MHWVVCGSRDVAKRHFSFLLEVSREGTVVQSRVGQGWRSEHPVCAHVGVMKSIRGQRSSCVTAH